MTMRVVLLALAACAALASSGASAADMPEAPPPQVIDAPHGNLCGVFHGRQVDRTWRPGQVAYIVAATCDPGGKLVSGLQGWLHRVTGIPRRENVLVYYNGGSVDRTDITSINVPYQPQLH